MFEMMIKRMLETKIGEISIGQARRGSFQMMETLLHTYGVVELVLDEYRSYGPECELTHKWRVTGPNKDSYGHPEVALVTVRETRWYVD